MLQRGPVRERNVEDEVELVENGTYPPNGSAKEEKAGLVSGIVGERSMEAGGEGGTLNTRDKRALALLVALYLLQGIPVGLAFGSIPFLLRSKLSYSQIGIFTLCTYPYSLKLLWSPIVDSIFSPKLGRRKSWIVPIQTIVGLLFWWLGNNVQQMMEVEEPNVHLLTGLFFTLVFFAATQDIAVDGWALTLLSKENLSYASTAQTIGLNTGYFLSFTVFLAFNSVEFSNKYFRSSPLDYPLISLSGYLHFWAFAFVAVTAYLAVFQPEDPVTAQDQDDMDLKKVYSIMVEICKLKHVQSFMIVHLVTKLGTAANDAATSLKLLEKGLKKEDLALAVLIDFPFQILFGYLAAKWSKGEKPLRPWLIAMWTRLGWAAISMLLISNFPQGDIGTWYFLLVVACTVGSSFSSTVQFLLNTVSNLGGTWPKFFVLKGIDAFSVAVCHVKDEGLDVIVSSRECVSDHGKAACAELGGTCLTERDGYYWVSTLCILTGVAILVSFVQPVARRLQTLPAAAWRIKRNGR
ncbi:MFS transporter, acetyl-CoA transporter [Rhodotorula toruloides]|uniref:MFS transporter, acetyl-CoA transporter n=1 Tax=Rhodotorula toruloides TaxID=5286 RepID=A0A511KKX6_RHOTO|nr:MFS transporter, acetyl-CoA transporter [Rhodotorula toruloides]